MASLTVAPVNKKDGQAESSSECPECPLVVGCGKVHKPLLLSYFRKLKTPLIFQKKWFLSSCQAKKKNSHFCFSWFQFLFMMCVFRSTFSRSSCLWRWVPGLMPRPECRGCCSKTQTCCNTFPCSSNRSRSWSSKLLASWHPVSGYLAIAFLIYTVYFIVLGCLKSSSFLVFSLWLISVENPFLP